MDKLIFSQTFEGIFRALGPRLDAGLAERLRVLGVDPTRPLRPAYPLAVFQAAMRAVGEALYPELDEARRMEAIGRVFMDGYVLTMVGKAMAAMMRVMGPRRTLERLSRQFRTGNNFSETRLTELAEGEVELWCNQVTIEGWYVGLIERGLELAGARSPRAEVVRRDETGATFRVRWEH